MSKTILLVLVLEVVGHAIAIGDDYLEREKELLTAITNSDHTVLKKLFGEQIKQRHREVLTFEYTPLMMAAGLGKEDVVIFLLAAGHNIEETNFYSGQPLNIAAMAGHTGVVDILLSAGADVNRPGRHSPLISAAMRGHLEIVRRLVKTSADVNAQLGNGQGKTALMFAAMAGHTKTLEYLLENGADIDRIDTLGGNYTALMAAAIHGRADCVKLLVKKNANLAIADREGKTALHLSVMGGSEEVEAILREAGAKADEQELEKLREERRRHQKESELRRKLDSDNKNEEVEEKEAIEEPRQRREITILMRSDFRTAEGREYPLTSTDATVGLQLRANSLIE